MPTFVSKPVRIEAVQWDGSNASEVRDFAGSEGAISVDGAGHLSLWIEKSGVWSKPFDSGTWIIRERDGNGYYPCDDEQFRERYSLAGAPPILRDLGDDPDGDVDGYDGPVIPTVRSTRTLLLLVGAELPGDVPTVEVITSWSEVVRAGVAHWAAAVHLSASDNDNEVPTMPDVLR